MFIYILRHGIAVQRGTAGYPNDDRPLTDDGKEKMRKGARGIAAIIGSVDVIMTSPLIRAHDTAKIAADALGADHKIEVCKELLPGSSAKKLMLYLAKYKNLDHVMIVGHEPDLGFLASALLGSEQSIIEFKKGRSAVSRYRACRRGERGRFIGICNRNNFVNSNKTDRTTAWPDSLTNLVRTPASSSSWRESTDPENRLNCSSCRSGC